jgi:hypothetical protein
MPRREPCLEPRIGNRIKEYNNDAGLSAGAKVLSIEEKLMFEAHLIRCRSCRKKLTPNARIELETVLLLTGFFLDDPVLFERRRELVRQIFQNQLSFEKFKGDWLEISREEREKLKSFLDEDC